MFTLKNFLPLKYSPYFPLCMSQTSYKLVLPFIFNKRFKLAFALFKIFFETVITSVQDFS